MTDTTQAAATPAPAPATSNILKQIENALSSDWAKVSSVFQEAEQFAADFLGKVASGAEILIADIESAASYIAGNLTVINAGITSAASLANVIAPNNATVQKAVADLQTTAQDVADLHTALTTGSSSGDPAIVTSAVTAINAVNQLSTLATSVSQSLGTLAANSPTATQAVTAAAPGTPAGASS